MRLAFIALIAALAVAAPEARGHSSFLESQPAPGANLKSSPERIALEFTEPVNTELTEVSVVATDSGEEVESTTQYGRQAVTVHPAEKLQSGTYRVDWWTVSTLDGHPREGQFSFRVGAPATNAEQRDRPQEGDPSFGEGVSATGSLQQAEQSPSVGQDWLRIATRSAFYVALFFFAGGLIGSALLSRRDGPADWLYPSELPAEPGSTREAVRGRAWQNTIRAGWVAAVAAAAVALVETHDATGGLSISDIDSYLLANSAGLARLAAFPTIVFAVLLASPARNAAMGFLAAAMLTIALSGHAASAEPRTLAVTTDWMHLLAGGAWIGGTAQIATVWVPLWRRVEPECRWTAMRAVLRRFGGLALPAFFVVAATGLTNALIQLNTPSVLWESAYGRILAVKIFLVGLIALASYAHALRLRPWLLSRYPRPHPSARRERRHWRLLSVEPLIGGGVVLAAAALVAYPLPPPESAASGEETAEVACDPCPIPEPGPGQLAVAEAVGSHVVGLWLDTQGTGTARIYDRQRNPADLGLEIQGGRVGESCGTGCLRVRTAPGTERVRLIVRDGGSEHAAVLPVGWNPGRSAEARRLLFRAQREMRSLQSVQIREETTSGPGTGNEYTAVLRNSRDRRLILAVFRWARHSSTARWLSTEVRAGQKVHRVALVDRGTPAWYRLEIEARSGRVLRERLVTTAHFIERRYSRFNAE